MRNVSSDDELLFYNKALAARLKLPSTVLTKITEHETG